MLIKAGADVNARDNNGKTTLMYATYYGREEIVEMLIKAGADVNARDNNGNTALMYAISQVSFVTSGILVGNPSKEKIVEMLIKAGADVNIKNKKGQTALLMVVEKKETGVTKRIVEMLIRAGADVNAKRWWFGKTPLTIAIEKGNKEIAELLRDAETKRDTKDKDEKVPFSIRTQTEKNKTKV
jgi:ankyrin repeat protein